MKKEFKATLTVLLCVAMLLSALLGCRQQHEDDEDPPHKDKATTAETTSPTTTTTPLSVDTTTSSETTTAPPDVPPTPQKIEVDLVTPFQECFWFEGPNGQGEVVFAFKDERIGSTDLKFGDFYFIPSVDDWSCDHVLKIVYQNEKVGIVEFNLQNDRKLKKGDKILVQPHFREYDDMDMDVVDLFELLEKEIVVPDLGDYVTQSTELTSGVVDRIMDVASYHFASEHEEASLLATYTLDLKPGYTKDYISSEKSNRAIALIFKYSEETFSDQKYIAYNILWLTDLVYVSEEHPNVHYSYNAECVKSWLKEFDSFEEAEAYLNQEYNTSCQISKIS